MISVALDLGMRDAVYLEITNHSIIVPQCFQIEGLQEVVFSVLPGVAYSRGITI